MRKYTRKPQNQSSGYTKHSHQNRVGNGVTVCSIATHQRRYRVLVSPPLSWAKRSLRLRNAANNRSQTWEGYHRTIRVVPLHSNAMSWSPLSIYITVRGVSSRCALALESQTTRSLGCDTETISASRAAILLRWLWTAREEAFVTPAGLTMRVH